MSMMNLRRKIEHLYNFEYLLNSDSFLLLFDFSEKTQEFEDVNMKSDVKCLYT